MHEQLVLTWRGVPPSDAIAERVRQWVERLRRYHDHITGCATTIEKPSSHHRQSGSQYRVRIEVTIPGSRLLVTRDPAATRAHADLYATVNTAFREARRQLLLSSRRAHHLVKSRAEVAAGEVVSLFPRAGYGFLRTAEGREIYFHEKSVLHAGFRRLRPGMWVRYVEEAGQQGPQASTVAPLHAQSERAAP